MIACNGQTFDTKKYPQLAKLYTDGKLPNLNDNRFLEGSTTAGTSKDAGLPQHTHSGTTDSAGAHHHGSPYCENPAEFTAPWGVYDENTTHGGSYRSDQDNQYWNTSTDGAHTHAFTTGNASTGIYGKSSTVQPKSYTVTYYVCYA